jgi:uncharacterized protein (TIGR02246 family)
MNMTMSASEVIAKEYGTMAAAFERGDADSIAEMYTDDAEMFVPGVPVILGKTAIRETWRSIVGAGGNRVAIDVREVQESGDLAYDTGRFTATAADGSVLNMGKWMVIWKRESRGGWKVHRDFMHWDTAPATA